MTHPRYAFLEPNAPDRTVECRPWEPTPDEFDLYKQREIELARANIGILRGAGALRTPERIATLTVASRETIHRALQGESWATPCVHSIEVDRHENDDRVRVRRVCNQCERVFYGCKAKRLDSEGREAWGPVDVQHWSAASISEIVDNELQVAVERAAKLLNVEVPR